MQPILLSGLPASDVLHIPTYSNQAQCTGRLAGAIDTWRSGSGNYLVVVGNVLGVKSVADEMVAVEIEYSTSELRLTRKKWNAILRAVSGAKKDSLLPRLHDLQGRLLIVAVVQPTSMQVLDVRSAAAIMTTDTFVPMDSIHELDFARQLTLGGISFVKPQLPTTKYCGYVPDFVLQFDRGELVIEVAGMREYEYLSQLRAKAVAFHLAGFDILVWFPGSEPHPKIEPQCIDDVLRRIDERLALAPMDS